MNKTVQLKELSNNQLETMKDMLESMAKHQSGENLKNTKKTINGVLREIKKRAAK